MLLRVGPTHFWQTTGKGTAPGSEERIPYGDFPFERTTWGAWRAAHPDTDIYVGVKDSPPPAD